MKRDGYNRTSLCARCLHVVLFGRNFRFAFVSALIGFASVALSQSPPYERFQYDMETLRSDVANLLHYAREMHGDMSASDQPLGIQPMMWDEYVHLYQPLSSVDGWDPHTLSGKRGFERSKGLTRILYDLDVAATNLNDVYGFKEEGSYGDIIRNDAFSVSWWISDDPVNNPYLVHSFPEFASLVFGANVDANLIWQYQPDYDLMFSKAFNPRTQAVDMWGSSAFAFYNVWEAEAWRRMLGSLSLRTNSWWAVTNSTDYKTLDRVFESQQFRDYYIPKPGDEPTSNFVAAVPEIETEMPHLGFELVGTNVVQLRDLNDITNAALHLQPEDILPGYDVGQWLFRVSGNAGDNSVGGTYEVDLSGSPFAQWATRIPNWIQLLCNIVYYAFSAVIWFKTAVYYMDKVPE